jgi:excisionase family DNA binding protein
MRADKTLKVTNGRLAWRVADLAEELGLSPSFVRLEITRGNLEAIRIGRRVLVLAAAVKSYLAAHREAVAG